MKKLSISAANNYHTGFVPVPVNSPIPIAIESPIGNFYLHINIKNFRGSSAHSSNSCYNIDDGAYLNNEPVPEDHKCKGYNSDNLFEIVISFIPKGQINGADLIFGNDFTYSIKKYLPTTLLSTGLKFFNWFIDSSVKGDVYADMPYLYGFALASFARIHVSDPSATTKASIESGSSSPTADGDSYIIEDVEENLYQFNPDIPQPPAKRMKYFTQSKHDSQFNFDAGKRYDFKFETNFINLKDGEYKISIPTFHSKTFDINILEYLNEKLDNVNYVFKKGGFSSVLEGELGLIIKFQLVEEP